MDNATSSDSSQEYDATPQPVLDGSYESWMIGVRRKQQQRNNRRLEARRRRAKKLRQLTTSPKEVVLLRAKKTRKIIKSPKEEVVPLQVNLSQKRIASAKEVSNKSSESSSTSASASNNNSRVYLFNASCNKYEKRWLEKLGEVKAFKAKYGHMDVSRDGYSELRTWMANQRSQYRYFIEGKPSTMSKERKSMLEGAGLIEYFAKPSRSYHRKSSCKNKRAAPASINERRHKPNLKKAKNNLHKERWMKKYHELLVYKEKHGDIDVPIFSEDYPGLRTWINNNRTQYRCLLQGKPTSMSEERKALLDEVGVVWVDSKLRRSSEGLCLNNFPDLEQNKNSDENKNAKNLIEYMFPEEVEWQTMTNMLKLYIKEHGDCLVSPIGEYAGLCRWMDMQRQDYWKMKSGMPNRMTYQKVHDLERIGFIWFAVTSTL